MNNTIGLLSCSSIEDFYAGRSIFMTGGTGFLGKVLIEKLLRSCRKLNKIYILVRERKNLTIEQRINYLTKDIIFDDMKNDNPELLKKLVPIRGDLTESKLITRDNEYDEIIKNVSVVFHLAASVRFDEPIDVALRINVEGSQKVLELCRQLENIAAFVHISTAFSNTDKEVVEEKVYLPPVPLDEVYTFLKIHGNSKEECMKLIKSRPNTYTFTKALAEYEVEKIHGDIPTAILRPSVVTAIWKKPVAGWLVNWYGLTGLMFGISKGHLRFLKGNGLKNLDIVPVDIVANMTILAATRCSGSNLNVYNCCSGLSNPINFNGIVENSIKISATNKWHDMPWPSTIFIKFGVIVKLLQFMFHFIPAYCLDAWCLIRGRKPQYVKLVKKYSIVIKSLEYFITNSWHFKDNNARELIASVSKSDKEKFYCDPADIDWKLYFTDYLIGVYRFLLNTPIDSTRVIR